MPQSLVKNYMHITFSTKNRYPFIDGRIKEELFIHKNSFIKMDKNQGATISEVLLAKWIWRIFDSPNAN
jgi:hypothetical protein